MAKEVQARRLREALRILKKHGLRAVVHNNELFIDARDWRRFNKLCNKGKLPKWICDD